MNQFPRRLLQVWDVIPTGRRVLLAGTAGLLVAVSVLLYSWSTAVTYVTLFSGLETQDSAAITDQLRTKNIAYKIEGAGTAVTVPQDQVDQLRLDFAAQGLPKGGSIGFELMNGNGFTATDFVQRLNFQRGLQGELQRTIESLSAVERARVHIVMPEKSLFVKDQRPATASVVLKLRGGQRLDQREVRGISHLVSGAVEGLNQSAVTILDSTGAVLFDGSQIADSGGAGASGSQLELQQAYERNLETTVQQLLDRTIGAGHSTVKVAATLNFDHQETTTESYSPGPTANGVPRSSSTTTEKYTTAGGAGAGAVPGAVANLPGAATDNPGTSTAAGGTSGTDYTRTETTANFEVGKTSVKNVQAVGGVRRLSVSLLLDDKVPEDKVQALQDAVAAAVGLSKDRGDAIAVGQLTFDRTAIEEADVAFAAQASQDSLMGYARLALPVVALLLGFVLFRMLLRATSGGVVYQYAEMQGGALPPGSPVGALGAAVGAIRALPAPPPDDARSDMEARVGTLISAQPQMVTDVMQAWLKEDR